MNRYTNMSNTPVVKHFIPAKTEPNKKVAFKFDESGEKEI